MMPAMVFCCSGVKNFPYFSKAWLGGTGALTAEEFYSWLLAIGVVLNLAQDDIVLPTVSEFVFKQYFIL